MRKAVFLMLVSLCCVSMLTITASCNSVKLDVSSSALIGNALIGDGLALIPVSWDGTWELTEKDGARVMQGTPEKNNSSSKATNHYYYFGIDDFLKPESFAGNATVTIVYYDGGFSQCILEYDSDGENKYKKAATFTGKRTGEWKTFSWTLTDAGFYGRQNGGADFRIYVRHSDSPAGVENITVLIREIAVSFD